jgi:hypothetical protein
MIPCVRVAESSLFVRKLQEIFLAKKLDFRVTAIFFYFSLANRRTFRIESPRFTVL